MATGILSVLLSVFILTLSLSFFCPQWLWTQIIIVPLLVLALHDRFQTRHALLRNFPLIGRGRWIMEDLRPFIQQYFIESETDGTPISRMFRSIAYQRAKNSRETVPFGTRLDTYKTGYEWIGHSMAAVDVGQLNCNPRVEIGGPDCLQPYQASILNISAMSFGSLSRNAILALNKGAKLGNFYHNTGEGGISPYHLQPGGDLVWQVGTGYFGCRNANGGFCPDSFKQNAARPQIKMIEIKLSQGAKPGHGGILPADKNTPEIAEIRGVQPYTQVDSPPVHSAFTTPLELIDFIQTLRELSEGKPIGFKLSIGRKSEFMAICKAMHQRNITPDFITVDGGEGGTGAAPLEYTNSIGAPLLEALAFVDDCLQGFGLRDRIKVIASGKIISGFHIVKQLALGADVCNSARGMMLALGCVQSLTCNSNRCPTGVATQDPALYKGLVVEDKAVRVSQFHHKTVHAAMDIISSAGLYHPGRLNRSHVFRRVSQSQVQRYDEVYPCVPVGAMLDDKAPSKHCMHLREADASTFLPKAQVINIADITDTATH